MDTVPSRTSVTTVSKSCWTVVMGKKIGFAVVLIAKLYSSYRLYADRRGEREK